MYLIILITTIVIDCIWLFLTSSFYSKTFATMGATFSQLAILYGLYVYVLLSIGIDYLQNNNADWKIIFMYGFIVYGVYDGTMLATFDNYDKLTAVIDHLWGGVLTLSVNYITSIYKYM
jgi:uncharacterized membrane protein